MSTAVTKDYCGAIRPLASRMEPSPAASTNLHRPSLAFKETSDPPGTTDSLYRQGLQLMVSTTRKTVTQIARTAASATIGHGWSAILSQNAVQPGIPPARTEASTTDWSCDRSFTTWLLPELLDTRQTAIHPDTRDDHCRAEPAQHHQCDCHYQRSDHGPQFLRRHDHLCQERADGGCLSRAGAS